MTPAEHTALLHLALNGTALALLAAIETQAEQVGNGFLKAERYRLSDALDSIDAYLSGRGTAGALVLAAAGVELERWEMYVLYKGEPS